MFQDAILGCCLTSSGGGGFLAERTAGRFRYADGEHFEAMPWGSNGHVDEQLHRVGCWLKFSLTTEMPPFSGAVKKAT